MGAVSVILLNLKDGRRVHHRFKTESIQMRLSCIVWCNSGAPGSSMSRTCAAESASRTGKRWRRSDVCRNAWGRLSAVLRYVAGEVFRLRTNLRRSRGRHVIDTSKPCKRCEGNQERALADRCYLQRATGTFTVSPVRRRRGGCADESPAIRGSPCHRPETGSGSSLEYSKPIPIIPFTNGDNGRDAKLHGLRLVRSRYGRTPRALCLGWQQNSATDSTITNSPDSCGCLLPGSGIPLDRNRSHRDCARFS